MASRLTMRSWLAAAAVAWPMVLGGALAAHATREPRMWSAAVYVAASWICHQRPERSFMTAGVPWPVCGRCSGLYLGAAIGALAFLWQRLRSVPVRRMLVACAVPTIVTVIAELSGAQITNVIRAGAALPAGAAVALAILVEAPARHATADQVD